MPSNRGNKRTEYMCLTFDSQMEANFYRMLLHQQSQGIISRIELQPEFTLIPAFEKNGKKIRPMKYIADFMVYMPDGAIRVIDVKGHVDAVFANKKKLFDYTYPATTLELVTMRPVKFGGLGSKGDVTDSRYWVDIEELARLRKEEKKRAKTITR